MKYQLYLDMFTRTVERVEKALICFRIRTRAFDVLPILSCHVETVVLLSRLKQKPDDYINVTIELDDMDITSAETTRSEIDYAVKHGKKVRYLED